MTMWQDPSSRLAAVSAALHRARNILLARQDAAGWWSGRTASDVTLDAEGLLLREFLGLRTPELTNAAAQQIRSLQQADGSWAGGEISASVLAYLCLRLAGDSADAYHMAVAAGWIRDAGGMLAAPVSARVWLAVFGLTGWEDLGVPAPEAIFLPARYYARSPVWTGWSRQAAVALTVIGTLRPQRRLPFDMSELLVGGQQAAARDPGPDAMARRAASSLRAARSAARSVALRRCGQWIIDWQLRDGLPAGRRAVWACSLVALNALGYPARHPVLASGLTWIASVTAQPRPPSGPARPVSQRPPVRDTAMAIGALAESGLAADHPALAAAGKWLLAQRIEGPADGRFAQPAATTSGWSFGTEGYPAIADTAQVLSALSYVDVSASVAQRAIRRSSQWLIGAQGRDGNWARSAAVTAQVVHALARHTPIDSPAIRRGVVWLLREQRPDGSWPAGPGEAVMPTTAAVVSALLTAGVKPAKPVVGTAVSWLLGRQNPDGGWASKADANDGQAQPRRSKSAAAGTAQALAALLAAGGDEVHHAVDLGAEWLVRDKQADGGWGDRPTGRHAPRRRDALVPGLLLPLTALGRYVAAGDRIVGGLARGVHVAELVGDMPGAIGDVAAEAPVLAQPAADPVPAAGD